jgi:hypothetical protein
VGKTGADFAGLVAAKDSNLETSGTAPKDYKISFPNTEILSANPYLKLYNLVESPYSGYKPRTWQNTKDSDATVWFGNTSSPGFKCTSNGCEEYSKTIIVNPANPQVLLLELEELNCEVLNVAGNREHTKPGIFIYTYCFLMDTFKYNV